MSLVGLTRAAGASPRLEVCHPTASVRVPLPPHRLDDGAGTQCNTSVLRVALEEVISLKQGTFL